MMSFKCPNCIKSEFNVDNKCSSCSNGIIPQKTIDIIEKKINQNAKYYIVEYFEYPQNGNLTNPIEITFKVDKLDFHTFDFNTNLPFELHRQFPTNTVDLIDFLINNYKNGSFLN